MVPCVDSKRVIDVDIGLEKKRIRAEMKARRNELSHNAVREAAYLGANALFHPRQLNLFSRFRGFATYLSLANEFPTDVIVRELFRAGAAACVPYYQVPHETYAWAAFSPNDPLCEGYRGIPEPAAPRQADPAAIDVALIPGLAFDVCGGRIGYGGGVYDRLLPKLRAGVLRVALAFDFQVSSVELPQEEHDLPMDYIVTEKQWIDCRLARRVRRARNG